MENKLEIGKRIRLLRTGQGLSRENFCGGGSHLTVRQLARIENGDSLPNLATLTFIANTLSIPLAQLVDEHWSELSSDYVELKHQLIRKSLYGDKERIKEREAIFDQIYDRYYETLPADEQLAIEIMQASCDTYSSFNHGYSEAILEEHLPATLAKSDYTTNDLLILYLYFFACFYGREIEFDVLEKISDVLIAQNDFSNMEYCSLLQRNLISLISCQMIVKQYEGISVLLERINQIMEQTQDYHYKPVVDMLTAKYSLFHEKDRAKAIDLYDQAISGAGFLNDKVLQENIKREKEKDLSR